MRRGLAVLAFLMLGLAAMPAMAVEGSPFAARPAASPAAEGPAVPLPAVLVPVVLKVAEMQRDLHARLAGDVRGYAEAGSPMAALVIIGIAFLYGVFHAAGPGHGKMVIGSYFLSRQAPLRRGIALSLMTAAVQAVAAVLLVGIFAVILGSTRFEVLGHALTVELVSYVLLAAMGLYLAWRALVGKECCDHPAAGHDRDHAHHSHDHRHDRAHHHPQDEPGWRHRLAGTAGELPMMALAAGLRPCSGAIVVLLFALAYGVFWIGAVAVGAMGLGVAITTSLIGIGAIALRRGVVGLTMDRPGLYGVTMRSIAFAGATVLTLSGVLLFLAALERGTLL
ncbi:MAG: nickel/cobalt transporter [Alphaproteobacteria bacterium]